MISHIEPDGTERTIRWDDLHEVGILTTDEGPFREDVFFILLAQDKKSGCIIPQSAEGNEILLKKLQELPNFDNEAVIQAMTSTDNNKFLCWQRTT